MLPSFIGIGGQRCGTTWLHGVLSAHPGIFMSEEKELHYFSRHLMNHGLDWYERHFEPSAGDPAIQVRGEITPAYSTLKPPTIRLMRELVPDARLLLILRHPVERAWSQAMLRLGIMKEHTFESIPVGRFLRFFEQARVRRRTDYVRMLDHWESVFPAEQLHLTLYDRLMDDPRAYVRTILEHVGADPDWRIPDEFVEGRVHSSQRIERPDVITWYLATQWLDMTRRLDARLDGRVRHWVEDLERLAADAPASWRRRAWLNRAALRWPERALYAGYDLQRDRRLARQGRRILTERRAGAGTG